MEKIGFLLVIVIVFGFSIGACFGQVTVEEQIQETYRALALASDMEADVSGLVSELNQFLVFLDSGEYDAVEVSVRINEIKSEAIILAETMTSDNTLSLAFTAINLIIVLVLGYVVWRYFPTFFWRTWLRFRGNWLIE